MIPVDESQNRWAAGLRSSRVALGMAIAFAGLILLVSSIPAKSMPSAPGLWRWDKAIHACEYGIAALLVFRAIATRQARPITLLRLLLIGGLTFVLCSIFGCLDELYQGTVPGRDSSGYDVLADMFGACFASIVSVVLYLRKQ